MKILFDYQCFNIQNFGGVSRYFSELLNNFERDEEMDWELPISYTNNDYLKNILAVKENLLPVKPDLFDEILSNVNFKGQGALSRLKRRFFSAGDIRALETNKKNSIEKLKEGNFDIFHPTYYDGYFLDYIGSKPYVLTIYDLIHQIFPEIYMDVTVDKNKEIIRRADKIIAISESTKRDLVAIYGIEESKVEVTYLANSLVSNISGKSSAFEARLPTKYFLFVGLRGGYKNFFFFAQAFAIVAQADRSLSLVCTGPPMQKKELHFLKKLGIEDRVVHFYVDDIELGYLYKKAIALVFPSMYEGFGIPVLEAFSCSCPVLVSNTSSLSEIGEDAVIYFEPKNIALLIRALDDILHKQGERERLIFKGHQQLQKFSWSKNAKETKAIYKRVLKKANFSN